MSKKTKKSVVLGQPSWRVKNDSVDAYVTRLGGHLAPVSFALGDNRTAQPFLVAPWAKEKVPKDTPDLLRALRGDFFCMPFGNNEEEDYEGEEHPYHGEPASAKWKLVEAGRDGDDTTLHLRLKTKVRKGRVDKVIRLVAGHSAVYSRHTISGMGGPTCLGHHATLLFPDYPGSGVISTSKFVYGQTYHSPCEDPAAGGYSSFKPGAVIKSLDKVALAAGGTTDLSRYPDRRGFEDIAILVADPKLDVAWTAVTFPKEGYVWFSLKDPKVLASTLMWHSNAGRHYSPWNGRNINTLGLEEITGHFHDGLKVSVNPNSLSRKGYKTKIDLDPETPTVVNTIIAMAPIPKGFAKVKSITVTADGVTLQSTGRASVTVPLDPAWLQG